MIYFLTFAIKINHSCREICNRPMDDMGYVYLSTPAMLASKTHGFGTVPQDGRSGRNFESPGGEGQVFNGWRCDSRNLKGCGDGLTL